MSALSDTERARLRPGVDAAALERFLAAVPPSQRDEFVVQCLADPAPDELRRANLLAYWTNDPAAGRAAPLRGVVRVAYDFGDPALDALWRAVEPGAPEHA
ncbi:MAG: hypothetical protein NW201_10795 [Gemmatimonadales bacterium]|nr:hypothetical protein [Gemmatimonadales bacterium]